MTKEEAWKQFYWGSALNNADLCKLREAWNVTWDAAFEQGCVKGNQDAVESRVTKMIDEQEYAVQDDTKAPYKYKHVQYGYEFVASPDGSLVVRPTKVNKT